MLDVRSLLAYSLAAGLIFTAAAQDKKKASTTTPSDIPAGASALVLETEDGVYLSATYWKPKKPGKDVGVVVLPNFRTHTQREWFPFAQQLNAMGPGVITFDFRGFGQSTTLGPNATQTAGKRDSRQIRSADITRNADTIQAMLLDLDCIKQFLLRENNQGSINIRQYGIVAFGDMTTSLVVNWMLDREFSGRSVYSRLNGDIAALCLIAPSNKFKNYTVPSRIPEFNPKIPIFIISSHGRTGSAESAERFARQFRIPIIEPSGSEKRENERRDRPGGWLRIGGNEKKPVNIGIDFIRDPAFKKELDGVAGFMSERLKFKIEAPWEGDRDVDQAFNIVTSIKSDGR